ncbi:MAG: DNA repair protein RecN [Deltaproteobacteria bacterium]|nr:DNA repair protein RecN [Deltaproteobacteria bacterium]
MLSELVINNFALIKRLELSFGSGFNVLTGETGAGKSIIIGAVNLILGGRASADLIRDGSDEAEVQAVFSLPASEEIIQLLEDLGLPESEEVIIRRVITRSGRNRVYINGVLSTLTQLTRLGQDLVTVSGQHEHQRLLDPEVQLLLLDQYGGLMAVRAKMAAAHQRWMELRTRVSSLEKRFYTAHEKADLYEFQVKEIEAANLVPGEDEDLEQERNFIRNAEKIFITVRDSYDQLYGRTGAVTEVLDAVRSDLGKAAAIDDQLASQVSELEDAYYKITDAAEALHDHLDRLTFDPNRQEEIEERLSLISRLKKKYGPGLKEVMDYARRAGADLEKLSEMERELEATKAEAAKAGEEARKHAEDLSDRRKGAADRMSVAATEELKSLGMPQLDFQIRFVEKNKSIDPGPVGWDEIEFLISPNVGEKLKPLARIASGGELSRAMLGLKALLAGQEKVQTLIFDEVDAGIGGGVAEVIGRKIKGLSTFHQVLCITHLPQIAVFAPHHHLVFKEVRERRTVTDIRQLSDNERIEEVARMLGGLKPSAQTLAAAREMVSKASKRTKSAN